MRVPNYPRAWPEHRPPLRILFGINDINELVPVATSTTFRWVKTGGIPAADGPDINGGPTWTRNLILVWAHMKGILPVTYFGEVQAILSGPGAQELVEAASVAYLASH